MNFIFQLQMTSITTFIQIITEKCIYYVYRKAMDPQQKHSKNRKSNSANIFMHKDSSDQVNENIVFIPSLQSQSYMAKSNGQS